MERIALDKVKHERAPLVNERVALQKEVYGHKRKSTGNAEKPLSPMQKAKARSATEELPSFGEDKKSVEKHGLPEKSWWWQTKWQGLSATAEVWCLRRIDSHSCCLSNLEIGSSAPQWAHELLGANVHEALVKGVRERSALILEAKKAASCRNLLQLYRQERRWPLKSSRTWRFLMKPKVLICLFYRISLWQIGVDLIGPLKETTRGHRYIITLTDYFSEWSEAAPIANKQVTTVADFLYKVTLR